ncbi:MAG: hypothetical protein AB7U45_03710 [Desulfamplus sp.]
MIAEQQKKLMKEKTLFEKVFGTEEGRYVLQKLKDECFYTRSVFEERSPNAELKMAFNEGKRATLLQLLFLTDCPAEEYETIIGVSKKDIF